ncbi:MAG TPA: M23 family metallopeptidase [Candidatus Pseudogracilibacillus intestinigallinarum]|uniref:M23 family metallopeptidase n=1 Tax=Candidatus Pseudogracilibacillus intestinigallinarum TaxID=2838742 RepID=A0A9D1PQ22_9BACI|nr:M23 family metallopeptidase [Candidatus Pseudogracilibacillus intestinigallinarum]
MDKRIKEIRRGIKKRKGMRRVQVQRVEQKPMPIFPTLEESYDGNVDVTPIANKHMFRRQRLFRSFVGALTLFLLSVFLLQTNIQFFQPVAQFVHNGMKEEFPFAKVNEWYVSNFGSPLAIIPTKQMKDGTESGDFLTENEVIETFSTNGQGMTVLATNEENVNAMQRGVIIFAGNDKDYGKTIVVQHANNSTTTYGQLKDVDVHIYETVEAGDRIGKASKAKEVYVQMEKNNTYMDPLEVIQVDDSP